MMIYIGIILLCSAIVPGSFSNDDIHKFLTPEELQELFHRDNNSVPEYEIIKVHWSKRSLKRDLPDERKMHITAFGDDIDLWLHPRDSTLAGENTPVYYANYSPSKPNGVDYSRRDGLMAMVGQIYEDQNTKASLLIGKEESGRTSINGYIASKQLGLRSLPCRIENELKRRRLSLGNPDSFDSPHHVVFRAGNSNDGNYPELPVNVEVLRQRAAQNVSAIPDTLYPEILVMVEYSITKAYGSDICGLLQYILAFWNGVDLKFRSIESPKVRLHISGIIIAQDPRATPYISKNSLGENVFNSSAAFASFGEHFYAVRDEFPSDSYDVVVTMTGQHFGIGDESGLLGIANTGTACKHFDGYYATSSLALVRDDGAFANVLVAAHELGHSLGSPHDYPGAGCEPKDGFVMRFSPRWTKKSSDFSNCSLTAFETHLKAGKLDCLFNEPADAGRTLPRLMPGNVKSLKEQCENVEMVSPCQSPDVCINLYCTDERGNCGETGVPASAGSSCGNNKICLHMKCVSL